MKTTCAVKMERRQSPSPFSGRYQVHRLHKKDIEEWFKSCTFLRYMLINNAIWSNSISKERNFPISNQYQYVQILDEKFQVRSPSRPDVLNPKEVKQSCRAWRKDD